MDTTKETSCAPQRSKNLQKKFVVTVFAVVINEKIEIYEGSESKRLGRGSDM